MLPHTNVELYAFKLSEPKYTHLPIKCLLPSASYSLPRKGYGIVIIVGHWFWLLIQRSVTQEMQINTRLIWGWPIN